MWLLFNCWLIVDQLRVRFCLRVWLWNRRRLVKVFGQFFLELIIIIASILFQDVCTELYVKLHNSRNRIGSRDNRVVIIYLYSQSDIGIELHRKPFYWFTSTHGYRYRIVRTSNYHIESTVDKSCSPWHH